MCRIHFQCACKDEAISIMNNVEKKKKINIFIIKMSHNDTYYQRNKEN